jgi:hypothetical protein
MHRFTLQAVMLFTLLTLPPAVMAARTYDLQSGPSLPMGWTLSGTITTDGTIGTIQATNILSWTWTMTSGVSSFTVSSTDPGAAVWTSTGITSTGAALLVPYLGSIGFDGPGGALQWDNPDNQTQYNQVQWGVSTGGFGGPGVSWWQGMPAPWSLAGQIASASPVAVPEPSPLSIAAFGALCGCVHVIGHKRRARRTATTGA